jgi:predicted nucleotidyltransferase
MPSGDLLELLFGAYRRKVLGLLLLRPDESFHVREIARLTGVPAGSLHRELKSLADAGLLEREPVGNQVRYRANRLHQVYAELAEIFAKTAGLADVLRDALLPLSRRIELAFVFGSLAQGKQRAVSDVDVFVVGDASFAEVVKVLAATQPRLGREVNPVVMTRRDVRARLKAGDRFVARVAREPKIFLMGSEDDFRKLAKDRAA